MVFHPGEALKSLTGERRILLAICLAAPSPSHAAAGWSFPGPVAPPAHTPLSFHPSFMIATTAFFAVAFAILLHSMLRHRKNAGGRRTLDWLWALLPFAILLLVNFILMGNPMVRDPALL